MAEGFQQQPQPCSDCILFYVSSWSVCSLYL